MKARKINPGILINGSCRCALNFDRGLFKHMEATWILCGQTITRQKRYGRHSGIEDAKFLY